MDSSQGLAQEAAKALHVAEELSLQPNMASVAAQEKIYSRTHANGEIHSGTAREIGRVCTALIGASIESLDTKLEMYEVGSQIIAKEQKQQSEAEAKPKRSFHKVDGSQSGKAKKAESARTQEGHAAERPVKNPNSANEKVDAAVIQANKQEYAKEQAIIMAASKPKDPEPRVAAATIEPVSKIIVERPPGIVAKPEIPKLIRRPIQPIEASGIAAAKPEAVPIIPPVAHLEPRLAETQFFERMFPPELRRQEPVKEASPEAMDGGVELPGAAEQAAFAEWEEVDLSAEVDQLLVELGLDSVRPESSEVSQPISLPRPAEVFEPMDAAAPEEQSAETITQAFAKALREAEPELSAGMASDPLPEKGMPFEDAGDVSVPKPLLKEVAAKIERVEPEKQQEAVVIMLDIAAVIQKITELSEDGPEEADQEVLEELERLCAQLLETIGLETDAQTIRQFARVVRRSNFAILNHGPIQNFDKGTHERKQGLQDLFNSFASTFALFHTHASIGNLALSAASQA